MIIILTNKAKQSPNGYYIGRPSELANIFPTKHSNVILSKLYSHEESMTKYRRYILNEIKNNIKVQQIFKKMKEQLKTKKYLQMNCFCINKKIDFNEYIPELDKKCHGEIIIEILYHNIKNNLFIDVIEKNNKLYVKGNFPIYIEKWLKEKKYTFDKTLKSKKIINYIQQHLNLYSKF